MKTPCNRPRKAIFLIVLLAALGLAADALAQTRPLRILCSSFPIYQITRNVTLNHPGAAVSLMLPAELGCPHDYALKPQDMRLLANADVLVINGLGLEQFLGPSIKQANSRLAIIDSSEGITNTLATPESSDHDHDEHGGPNPHLFASPKQAARLAATIARGLGQLDPEGSEAYRRNSQAYAEAMTRLGQELSARAAKLASPKIITQHGVFDYLARDIGLDIVAVIEPHPGQEPSAAEMLALIKTLKASQAKAIFAEPQYPAKIVRTIAKEVGIKAATLDPAATGPDKAGLDYYETVMRANMATLESTLGVR